jgi:prophage regulatory protein
MPERFMNPKSVIAKVCLSKTEIYQRINSGRFPKPIALGPRKVVFLESEIDAWMQQQIEHSNDGRARRLQARRAVSCRRDRTSTLKP